MDYDDNLIKIMKEKRAFLSSRQTNYMLCQYCGGFFSVQKPPLYYAQTNQEMTETKCPACLEKRIVYSSPLPEEPAELKVNPSCRYCFKRKKLVGAWCPACRDKENRREINRLLAIKFPNYDEKESLEFLKKTPVWKKEFKGKK